MGRWRLFFVVILVLVVVWLTIFWVYYTNLDNTLKHETNRWAVIKDSHGDRIAVEPTSSQAWSQLVALFQNQTIRWIGGMVETYDNKWGFRFKPENITIAEVTAEGLQTYIKWISEDLSYWLNLGWAYVSAQVTEIHSPS
ncbi:MAG: hypothetical protein ACQXXH_06645 [Candidatus Bathyarchaeia archaeon]|jgi:hypothetical protein|nr:hypothetical protein [Candidatus Bathyarchaeota archaeon A05DMB-4]MDH7595226.1 hypothetical protein [Candidatus Bathyarchaeota archaeon]